MGRILLENTGGCQHRLILWVVSLTEVSEAVGQTWACLVSWAAISCWNRVSGEQGDSFEDVKKLIAA